MRRCSAALPAVAAALAMLLSGVRAQTAPPSPALPLPAPAEAAVQGFSPERLQRLDDFLAAATRAPRGHLGAVALVARNGRVVHFKAYGQLDIGRRAPMGPDSIFRIRSMSKPVASVAALMLMEEGLLTLDDPVALHLPAFAGVRVFAGGTADAPQLRAPARALTIRHLLTHTAGFATGGPGSDAPRRLLERAAPDAASSLEDYAARVARAPLAADPGSRFQYDGVNTEVLSRVVEVVAGMPFETFLERRIFEPLKMVDTGFTVAPDARARIADISAVGPDGALVLAPGSWAVRPGIALNAYSSGAGGLYSTAADYLRFAQMLLNGGVLDGVRLLGRKTVDLMRANQLAQLDPIDGLPAGEGFGLGVSVSIEPARRARLTSPGAYGWTGSATTYFTIDPQESMIAILLMQHLPRDDAADELPKPGVKFFNLVYQALER